MESANQIMLRFKGVDIFRVNFASIKPFSNQEEVKMEIHPKVFYPEGSTQEFRILMDVKVSCASYFDLTLTAIGNFEFTTPIESEQERKNFVNVNAVAIMFPYVRAFISTITSNVGKACTAITIPARFFKGELEEFKPQQEELAELE